MILPDMLQFLLIVAALAFMSASTLFIFSEKQEKKQNEQIKQRQRELQ